MARASAATHARSGAAAVAAAAAAAHWEVEYARFFNFPRRSPSSSAAAAALLRPLRKKKLRSGGTWIAAASAASLRLVARRPASVAVLSVSVGDDVIVHSEVCHAVSHRICVMVVSCGIAIILLHMFYQIKLLDECSRDTMDILLPGSDFVGDDSSASEYNASSRLHYGYNEMSNSGEAVGINEEQEDLFCQPLLANNIETIFSNFPRGFTELPNGCSNDTGKGAEGQLKLSEEADLKSLVEKYSADASFYDMLLKLDKVIDHLGGDLALS
ncbi:hypothetical protein ACMD2_24072 [Ananas comosus]|uniref:Poor homologous synapsis 1 PH domain-containing protein n=1 Tax=Ananas comosus TaxID=4615 RepID=A0A199UVS0_ANACO|nr:hypothetical protein ACMD2_24072 [Ananas comosus]